MKTIKSILSSTPLGNIGYLSIGWFNNIRPKNNLRLINHTNTRPQIAPQGRIGGLSLTGFTLIELLIVVIILAILASIAIPVYKKHIEIANLDICTAHQEALYEAIKLYGLTYDSLPVNLAQAWDEFGEEAFAIVWERKKKEKKYNFLVYIATQKIKYNIAALFSLNAIIADDEVSPDDPLSPDTTTSHRPPVGDFVKNLTILRCPSQSDRSVTSYGLNSDYADQPYDKLKDRLYSHGYDTQPIIACCDAETFSGADGSTPSDRIYRHKLRDGTKVQNFITIDTKTWVVSEMGNLYKYLKGGKTEYVGGGG